MKSTASLYVVRMSGAFIAALVCLAAVGVILLERAASSTGSRVAFENDAPRCSSPVVEAPGGQERLFVSCAGFLE